MLFALVHGDRDRDGYQAEQTATGVRTDAIGLPRASDTVGEPVAPLAAIELLVGQFCQATLTRRVIHVGIHAC